MKYSIYIILAGLIITFSSCERNFEETNINPNDSAEVEPQELFSYAQFKYHTDFSHGVNTEIWGLNSWMQVQANLNGISSAGDEYFINSDALNNTWQISYSDVLGNVSEAIRLTNNIPEKANENSIYRIYRAYVFHRLTDLWGNIPYSAAHNTINDQNAPDYTPVYDSQESIYSDLFNELKEAKDALDNSLPSLGNQDIMYHGDVEKWQRFANSLRLRLAIRISGVSPTLSAQIIDDVLTENLLIENNDQGAHFPHSAALRSPFYELDNTGQGMYNPSEFLLNTLDDNNDPRIEKFATFSPQSITFGTFEYVGMPSFIPSANIDPDEYNTFTTSYIGDYFLDANLKGTSLGYPEVCFLLAEAAVNGAATTSSAEAYYNMGVTAHMEDMNINASDISSYLQNEGAFDGSLEKIISEKWKTLVYVDAIELFSEWRRTGYPVLKDANGMETNVSNIPKRLAYPQIEWNLNGENVATQGLIVNDFLSPVWWNQ